MESILFRDDIEYELKVEPALDTFKDLNLDIVVDTITSSRKEYDLQPFFYTPLKDKATILYRHSVMQDLEGSELFNKIKSFTQSIYLISLIVNRIRKNLLDPDGYNRNYIEKGNLLDAASAYTNALSSLAAQLRSTDLKSEGMLSFRGFLEGYMQSDGYKDLVSETARVKGLLSEVRYCMLIKDNCIKVRRFEEEKDLNIDIERVFGKFNEGSAKDYRQDLIEEPHAMHVEAAVLDMVAKLFPEAFGALDRYCEAHISFMSPRISAFSREVQFYISFLEFAARMGRNGHAFCYPDVDEGAKDEDLGGMYDIALAIRSLGTGNAIVTNDYYLEKDERIIVITGPNQGGKTTFARTVGQVHYLASLGCMVPAMKARLFIQDRVFTHFEREEDVKDLNGKLQSDLVRIKDILDEATPDSLIIINELLSSTSLQDAVSIGRKIMEKVVRLGCLCLYVTFLDELAAFSEKNVSMVSTVSPEDPSRRTFKIVRKPADGLAYALSIAKKYGLTYGSIKERI